MVDLGGNFDNLSRRPDQFKTAKEEAREIVVLPEHAFNIPQTILDSVSAKQKESRFGVYSFNVDMATIADLTMSNEEKDKLATLPYKIMASDKYLFVSSSAIKDPQYPHANLQILRLEYDLSTGAVTKIIRDADPSMFKVAITDFPDNTLIGKARKATSIEPASDNDRKKYADVASQSEKMQAIQKELLELRNSNFFSGTLLENEDNKSRIKQVGQAEYSVATSSQAEWLATFGATDCFIVSLYDKTQKRGSLAHIDALTDAPTTVASMRRELVAKAIGGESPEYSVTLSGGSLGSVAGIARIYEDIKLWKAQQGGKLDISVGDLFTGNSESLALNLNTGEITRFTPLPQPSKGNGLLEVMKMQTRAMETSMSGKKPAKRI